MPEIGINELKQVKDQLEEILIIKKARKDFATFSEYVFGYKPGQIHLEWFDLANKAMANRRPCVIFAPRGHSKCCTPDTVITMANGEQKKIVDCKVEEEILALNEKLQFVPAKIVGLYDNGVKDVYEVELVTGKKVRVTSNHPFLTGNGWKSLDDGLSVGEKVAFSHFVSGKNIKWGKIKSIKYIGKYQTYGLEVEKYHNHLTNGIVTHNTTYMSVIRTIFLLGHNPNLRIKIISHSNDKAADILRQIKEAIEQNDKLHKVFPNLKPGSVWSANKIIIERTIWSKDVSIEASGVLSGATGGRCDYLVADDVVEFKNTLQEPAKIPMVKEAFYNNWLNLLEADNYGWCLIGTIWTQYDLHWDLYKNDSFKYKRMYRIDLNTLEPIWPEYWSKEKLQQKLEEIGPRAFARAYGNMPISREDMVFNEDHINACKIRSEVKRFRKLCNLKILGVDLALSQKKKSANTALFLLGITPKEKFIPLHIEYGKWSSPETTRAIMKIYDEFDVDLVVVESNQYQDSLRQWINEFRKDIKVESYYTGSKKFDPEIGIPAMAVDFERKKWIIPVGKVEHPSDCKCGLCTWLNEVIMYPFAEHSDILMASYFAREGYRKHFKEKMTKGDYDVIDLF